MTIKNSGLEGLALSGGEAERIALASTLAVGRVGRITPYA
jgi:hypothetical protein